MEHIMKPITLLVKVICIILLAIATVGTIWLLEEDFVDKIMKY